MKEFTNYTLIKHLKIIFMLFFSSQIFIPENCLAQSIKGGIVIGFNATQIDGDKIMGFHKFGINAGAIAVIPLSKKFSVSMEILYTESGSKSTNEQSIYPLGYDYLLKLNYVEVPFLINFLDKERFSFGIGVSIGTLVTYKEYFNGLEFSDPSKPYTKRAYNYVANGSYFINSHWAINMRFSYSVIPIATRIVLGETHQQVHKLFTMRVIYYF